MEIINNQSLINFNTFHIDVSAKYFLQVSNDEEISEAIAFIKSKKLKYLILGGGSNVLFLNDFDGIVIHPVNEGIKIIGDNPDGQEIEIEAGQVWDDVVKYATKKNLFGIENLTSIPGTSGAAPIQNIGAYGVELKDTLVSVTGNRISNGKEFQLSNSDCKLGYRSSVFKHELKNDFLINRIVLRLLKKPKVNLNYSNLREHFCDKKITDISSQEISDVIRNIRKSKLPDPNVFGNAGSFFKNPVISKEQFEDLRKDNNEIPFYLSGKSKVKIPAGWLIEKCGFKGKRIGNVGSYEKQSLILVNYANAGGKEIINYAKQIKANVLKKFTIELEYEVNIIK